MADPTTAADGLQGELEDEVFGSLRLKRSRSKSGYNGVTKVKSAKKPYQAWIKSATRKQQGLGSFATAIRRRRLGWRRLSRKLKAKISSLLESRAAEVRFARALLCTLLIAQSTSAHACICSNVCKSAEGSPVNRHVLLCF